MAADSTGASRGPLTDPCSGISCCSAFQPKAQAGELSGCESHWCSLWLKAHPGLPLSEEGETGKPTPEPHVGVRKTLHGSVPALPREGARPLGRVCAKQTALS